MNNIIMNSTYRRLKIAAICLLGIAVLSLNVGASMAAGISVNNEHQFTCPVAEYSQWKTARQLPKLMANRSIYHQNLDYCHDNNQDVYAYDRNNSDLLKPETFNSFFYGHPNGPQGMEKIEPVGNAAHLGSRNLTIHINGYTSGTAGVGLSPNETQLVNQILPFGIPIDVNMTMNNIRRLPSDGVSHLQRYFAISGGATINTQLGFTGARVSWTIDSATFMTIQNHNIDSITARMHDGNSQGPRLIGFRLEEIQLSLSDNRGAALNDINIPTASSFNIYDYSDRVITLKFVDAKNRSLIVNVTPVVLSWR